jgi:hypothetical protein
LAKSIGGPARECTRKPGEKEQSAQREQQYEIRTLIHKIFDRRYAPSILNLSEGYFIHAARFCEEESKWKEDQ